MNYRPEIDGLRTVAVVPVILFHAGASVVSGGFVGVDVFFVISGYLITTIIYDELIKGQFSIAVFYERRCRRILAPLLLVSLACIPAAWILLPPSELVDFGQSLVAVATFSSNVLFWKESGYFEVAADLKPLLHTWSLAIEEQFYVLFPLFLMLVWRFGTSILICVLVLLSLLSLGLAQYGSVEFRSATFYLLPTRAWELLIGSLTAIFLRQVSFEPPRTVSDVAAAVGLAMVLYPVFAFDKTTQFPGFSALLPATGAAIVILFATPGTLVNRALSFRFMVGIGLVSYSFYLWHQPLFAFARAISPKEPAFEIFAGLSFVAFLLAVATYRLVEKPIRLRRQGGSDTTRVLLVSLGSLVVVAVLGMLVEASDGAAWRVGRGGKAFGEFGQHLAPNPGIGKDCIERHNVAEVVQNPDCQTRPDPKVLLWGDSFAMHLFQMLMANKVAADLGVRQIAHIQCMPNLTFARNGGIISAKDCRSFNAQVAQHISEANYDYVIMASPYKWIGKKHFDADGELGVLGAQDLFAALVNTAEHILDAGAIPVFVSPPPVDGTNLGRCAAILLWQGKDPHLCDFSMNELSDDRLKVRPMLELLTEKYMVIELDNLLCPNGQCRAVIEGVPVFRDFGHFSVAGSRLVGAIYDPFRNVTLPRDLTAD